jgi:predicted TIM-barrel fold metal-dependent hydrolase
MAWVAAGAGSDSWATESHNAQQGEHGASLDPPALIDTNVYLLDWPFRRLKYARPEALLEKLRRHRIQQAWAASFEGVWHKQLDRANRRLVEVCRQAGPFFVPIGTVNPAWPDWREDVRRCQEQYHMPGLRLFPAYHGYTLGHPEFAALLAEAARRGLFVQIAMRLEDERVHHPATMVPTLDVAALGDILERLPPVRVELLQADAAFRTPEAQRLLALKSVVWDISSLEGNAGLRRLLDGQHANYRGRVPVEKFVFGSHAPLFPVESAVWKLFESPLEKSEFRAVACDNITRWLQL